MRKVILFMVMSLDGFVCGPNEELDWENQDPAVGKYFAGKLLETTDTMLLGRVLYQGFEQSWPAMAKDPNSPKELVDFANWVIDSPKIVFSHQEIPTEWKNSRLVRVTDDTDITEEVQHLKQQPGGDMVIFGGAQLAQTLTKLGLVDEYWLKLQPIVLGAGKPLFKDIEGRVRLKLLEAKSFDSGVVTLRYEPEKS